MATKVSLEGDTLVITRRRVVQERETWQRLPGGWQLPCGCEGPKYWNNNELQQAICDHCGRRWWHMCVKAPCCQMMDGKPQGPKTVVGAGYPSISFVP